MPHNVYSTYQKIECKAPLTTLWKLWLDLSGDQAPNTHHVIWGPHPLVTCFLTNSLPQFVQLLVPTYPPESFRAFSFSLLTAIKPSKDIQVLGNCLVFLSTSLITINCFISIILNTFFSASAICIHILFNTLNCSISKITNSVIQLGTNGKLLISTGRYKSVNTPITYPLPSVHSPFWLYHFPHPT